ncbi:Uncharacterised protein [Candidatus Burarchaeum australiense]|nr:Uncharacterised protein [Candidatus Burarchaeum australiense]
MAQMKVQEPEAADPGIERKRIDGQMWLDNAKIYLAAKFVDNLEAGLQKIDPGFKFTQAQRDHLLIFVGAMLDSDNGRIILDFGASDNPILSARRGYYDPSTGKIHLNMSKIGSEEELLYVLTHELFHHISLTGAAKDAFALRNPFQEGSAEFLTQLVLRQDPEKAAKLGLAGYSLETFEVFALLKSEAVTLPAFLSAFLGANYANSFTTAGKPEDEFVDQLDKIRPGAAEDLFPDLHYYTFQSIISDSQTYASREIGALTEILIAQKTNLEDIARKGAEEYGIRVYAPSPKIIEGAPERGQTMDEITVAVTGSRYFAPTPGLSLRATRAQGEDGATFEIWHQDARVGTVSVSNDELENLARIRLSMSEIRSVDGTTYEILVPIDGSSKSSSYRIGKEEMAAILAASGYTIEQFEQMDAKTKVDVFKKAVVKAVEIGITAEET